MAQDPETVPIQRVDPEQDVPSLQTLVKDISPILTEGEEILYAALQGNMALSINKDSVAATSNRVILCNSQLLGRRGFTDFLWQDVKNVHLKEGFLSSEFTVVAVDGKSATIGGLEKVQARRLYSVCQQKDQEWREKRRVRQMEEDRARAGGVYMSGPGAAAEDPVERLAKAKRMLDQQLISVAEYETLKANILSEM
jgi:hypothetical protein